MFCTITKSTISRDRIEMFISKTVQHSFIKSFLIYYIFLARCYLNFELINFIPHRGESLPECYYALNHTSSI